MSFPEVCLVLTLHRFSRVVKVSVLSMCGRQAMVAKMMTTAIAMVTPTRSIPSRYRVQRRMATYRGTQKLARPHWPQPLVVARPMKSKWFQPIFEVNVQKITPVISPSKKLRAFNRLFYVSSFQEHQLRHHWPLASLPWHSKRMEI